MNETYVNSYCSTAYNENEERTKKSRWRFSDAFKNQKHTFALLCMVLLVNFSAFATTCPNAISIDHNALPTGQSLVCGSSNDLSSGTIVATGLSCSTSYYGGLESLYKFTPLSSGSFNIAYSGQTWSGIFVFQGCPTTAGSTRIGCITDSLGSKNVTVTLAAGTEYYIMFDTWPTPNSPCTGTFTMTGPPPPSDFPPTCATTFNPADATSNVVRNPSLTASGFTNGPTNYDLYLGTTPNPSFFGNYTTLPIATGVLSANTTYYWKLVPKNNVGEAAFCSVQSFTTGTTFNYCIPTNSSGCGTDAITNVVVGSYSNPTGCSTPNNSTYLGTGIEFGQGTTASVSVSFGPDGSQFSAIWIDYNQDGTFSESEGVLGSGNAGANGTQVFNILIPVDALLGTTRMRIRGGNDSALLLSQACGAAASSYGESEDYEITITTPPACFAANTLTTSNISSSAAGLFWVDPNQSPASSYVIEYGVAGFELGTGTQITEGVTNPFGLQDLQPNTVYTFYVKTICGEGNEGAWSAGASFQTLCESFDLPLFENFDTTPTGTSSNPSTPDCWSFIDTGAGYGYTYQFGTQFSEPNHFYLYNSSDNAGNYMLVSPQVNGLSGAQVEFYAYGTGTNYVLEVGTMSVNNDPSTFTLAQSIILTGSTSAHNLYTVNLPEGTDGFLAFRHGLGGTFRTIYIDDILVQTPPTCPRPLSVSATSSSSTTADVAWLNGAFETSWNIEYVVSGNAQGTGTVVAADANPFQLTGLDPNTEYDIYVQANCGAGDLSLWSPVAFVKTLCNATTLPISENFDTTATGSSTNPSTPDCWSFIDTGSGYGYTYQFGTQFSEPNHFYFYNGSDVSGDYILVSPQVSNLSGALVEFYAYGSFSTSYEIEVGTLSNPSDPSTFTLVQTILLSDVHELYSVTLPEGTDEFVGFRHAMNGSFQTIYLDDILVQEPPTCPRPTAVTATVASSTSADVAWTNGGSETEWVIEYGVDGFEPGTGTEVIVFENPYTLTDLTANTNYDIYVTAVCSEEASSIPSQPASVFTGACVPLYSSGKTDGDLISNVSIAGTTLSNNSGTDPVNPAYTYFTGQDNYTGELAQGSTYTVSVSVGTFGNQNMAAWIDFDNSLTFDADERIGYTTSSIGSNGSTTFNIVLPLDAPLGDFTLRIRDVYATSGINIDPCSSYGWGETEDYTITVVPAPPGTTIAAEDCGTTINSAFNEYFNIIPVENAQAYRVKIVNGVNEQVYEVTNGTQVRFQDFGTFNFTYGATYAVSVSTKLDEAYGPYGAACDVTLTDDPLTAMEVFCGNTIPGVGSKIYFHHVPQATNYRYSVTNTVTNEETFVVVNRRFMYLSDMEEFEFGTTYSIKCQVEIGGQYGSFGPACDLTTTGGVTSKLRTQFCNVVLTSRFQNVYADIVVGAVGYRFRVTNGADQTVVERTDSRFNLDMIPSTSIFDNTVYNVEVAVQYNGVWGNYGAVCTITTPPFVIPTTRLRTQFCNITVTSAAQNVYANVVRDATQYRFRVVNAASNFDVEVVRPDSRFTLAFAGGIEPSTTYQVTVAAYVGGEWGAYGSVCTLTTPALTPIQLRPQFCGTNLASLNSNFYAQFKSGAAEYRFRTQVGAELVEIYRPDSRCFLSAFGDVQTDVTYTVQASYRIGNVWSPWGGACTLIVYSPIPVITLDEASCGGTFQPFDIISAEIVPNATSYRFRAVADGNEYIAVTTSNEVDAFTFEPFMDIGTYEISVAAKVNNIWGEYGEACFVTFDYFEEEFRTIGSTDVTSTVAYPNPFDAGFELKFRTKSQSPINVAIYDMTGKLIEKQVITNLDVVNSFGANLAAGVYNVQVSQDEITHVVRVVKK